MAEHETEQAKDKDVQAAHDDASSITRDAEVSAGATMRDEAFSGMMRESIGRAPRVEEPSELDFGGKIGNKEKAENGDKANVEKPQQEKNPFEEMRRQIQEAREKERQENIDKIVQSLAKDGKFPDNVRDMFRDFEPRLNAGFYGDAAGIKQMVDEINKKLQAQGSQYHLDVTQTPGAPNPRRDFGSYESWTNNIISVRDNRNGGRVTDSTSVVTDPVSKPGIRY